MRKILLVLLLAFTCVIVHAQNEFITTWKTDNPGASANNQITIPTFPGETYNYSVDWGDGTSHSNITGNFTYTYTVAGTYQVKISGTFPGIFFGTYNTDKQKILSVDQWGNNTWKKFNSAFNGCSNLDVLATDVPDLSMATSTAGAFIFCQNLVGNSSFENWDMSTITNTSYMFYRAGKFNQDIGGWDVSQVDDMHDMFNSASTFNQDLNSWNVSAVTDMDSMFEGASRFNGDISSWNVGNVERMMDLFMNASSFNQDISAWNVGNVEWMTSMFMSAVAFNQDIGNWNVGNCRSMATMFYGATEFDQNLENWNIQSVLGVSRMFYRVKLSTENYDALLNAWSQLPNLPSNMIFDAGFSRYCAGSAARQNLINTHNWQISDTGQFCNSGLYVEKVLLIDAENDMHIYTLRNNAQLNELAMPSNLLNFEAMVPNTVGSVKIELTDSQNHLATANEAPFTLFGSSSGDYEGNVLSPGTYTLTVTPFSGSDQTGSQGSATILNFKILEGISKPLILTIKTDNPGTTANNKFYIKPMSSNNTYYTVDFGNGTIAGGLSSGYTYTYQNPGTYTIKIYGDFPGIQFENNGDATKVLSIDQWGDIDWSSARGAFNGCSNMDVLATDYPDLSNVSSSVGMFQNCSSMIGNASFSDWETKTLSNLTRMFSGAVSFDQDLGNWDVGNAYWMNEMFSGVTLSTENYDSILNGWSSLTSLNAGVQFDAGNSTYCDGIEGKRQLIANNWQISDGGDVCSFVTTWKTDNPGVSGNNQITIPTFSGETYDYTVYWGDGTVDTGVTGDITHTYPSTGTYNISIKGDFPRIFFDLQGDSEKLLLINNWGPIKWTSMMRAFAGCVNLDVVANDSPDLSMVTNTIGMFRDCSSLVGTNTFNSWDLGQVQSVADMFLEASSFNQEIGNWNMSQVSNTVNMFRGAAAFNQDISNWDVSQVVSMYGMFSYATAFDQNIGAWNTGKVENMASMFQQANSFNQDISSWDVSQVTSMLGMFDAATSFNQPLNEWDVSKVTNMFAMFADAYAFNQPLDNWNVSSVEDMTNLFLRVPNFNQNLGNWDVGKVASMVDMFKEAGLSQTNYDATLIGWSQLPAVQNGVQFDAGSSMYCQGAEAHQNIIDNYGWTISDGGKKCPFVTTWNTDNPGESADNQITIPIDGIQAYNYEVDWGDGTTNTGVTGNITHTYANAGTYQVSIFGQFPTIAFRNQGDAKKLISVDQWGEIQWGDMIQAFKGCSNMDVLATDTPDLTNSSTISGMFANCSALVGNESFNEWDVSQVTWMTEVFNASFSFNQDIGKWDVGNVLNMGSMFIQASSFNQDISNWNVSNVTSMQAMFQGAESFNQDIGDWDVSKVENMLQMFVGARTFNQDIGGWDVGAVTKMYSMFGGAYEFNQDIGDWDVSNVVNLSRMFEFATDFDQDLGNWQINPNAELDYFLSNAGLSTKNYDKLLIGWQDQTLKNNVDFGAGSSRYCDGETARQNIIDTFGWTITDAGKDVNCNVDNDNDGVLDHLDLCLETPQGSLVNSDGCLELPIDNFTVETIGETCPDQNNAQIIIGSAIALDFVATVNGTDYSFANQLTVDDLEPGVYDICITLASQSLEQCFVLELAESESISGKSSVENGKMTIEIEQGTAPYNVIVNNKTAFQTSLKTFDVDISEGDVVAIKTAKVCEGSFSKTVNLSESIAYPNPTKGSFEIAVPIVQTEVEVEVFTLQSQLISKKTYSVKGGKVLLNIEDLPNGVYIVKVNLENPKIFKIVKQ